MLRTNLRFAIIGCGRIAQRHAEQIDRFGHLVAVCDIIPNKANDLAKEFGAKAYYTTASLLLQRQSIDVIVVCTPNGLHALHAIEALNAGFHVLCEKPMAISAPDCRLMITTSEKNKRQLFVVKQNRFNPPVQAVKELLDQNKLGKIYSVQLNCYWNRNPDYYKNSWKGTKEYDGGTLFTQFSHFIDLLYWFFGYVKNVQAMLSNIAHKKIIEFEDTGIVNMEFENGIIGGIHYTVNSYKKNMEGSLTIFAEKGTVKIGGQYLNELEYQLIENYTIENLPKSNTANDYGTYIGSMSNHDKVYQNLVDVLLHGATSYANAYDGLKTVEIIEKIYKEAKYI
ncbi:Gfo/Idh/MocA family oxidoreductase [Panacibacter ginsenosidivorans]|uniref:Gfo/Idh/MocA family oxidoreductase n=1 Tax=Panacibacter ginsenosidivorans TaxID=1813871 RepID=A0A5B8V470_9BACT|nr:Gfo/Idh/MocA family oxidoreductase [Panacibacter ginsenosidivorans]QEC66317.1 Gfo/Idh/MocA family oxidoreductase [Panacibacter ginsenosidivorans]